MAWMKPVLELHYSGVPQPRVTNSTVFSREFTAAFGEIDKEESYRHKYRETRQVKSVTEYISDFRLYSSVLGYNKNTLKDDFYCGLKDNIKDVMMNQDYDRNQVSLQKLMDRATLIDAKLTAREMEKRGSSSLS
ncbi:hypothetical protein FRC09_000393 [Ceratobasidium sp. 395]|nr:hypothetical protein FRC09_000393 [Ceratobasidium sp. 395]